MNIKKHVLVIGGTGMLANACLDLARRGYAVSIIGRTKSKFQRLLSESPVESIFPLIVDINTDDVINQVELAIRERGLFNLIISWTPNYGALERICEMNQGIETFRLFHVKGSRRYFEDELIRVPANCSYRKVFLGFISGEEGSRWLTQDEIANGVIQQIDADRLAGIIGQIQPYDLRPMLN